MNNFSMGRPSGGSGRGDKMRPRSWRKACTPTPSRRWPRCLFGALSLLSLTGCATTRYVAIGCITQSQYDQLAAAKPGKVHPQLNGQADHDLKLIAGRLIRVEAWGDGELTILGGCITKDAH